MRAYNLSHLSDATLVRDLRELVARDRVTTAALLAHIAEVDTRRLYLPAAYTSMHAYCVGELHFSDEVAFKRIQAARSCREFPSLFEEVREGRLHLTAVCLLAPHMTEENLESLVTAATHRSRRQIERLVAERFGRREAQLELNPVNLDTQLLPDATLSQSNADEHDTAAAQGPEALQADTAMPKVTTQPSIPPPPARIVLKLSIELKTHDKLRHAQSLLSHAIPSCDPGKVLDRALDVLIATLEKRKFATTVKPRPRAKRSAHGRTIPATVRRAVWRRDRGRCTFRGENGRRCEARRLLEFDHAEPFARGGLATVEGIRLRCRAHNQFEAERVFGEDFMRRKREGGAAGGRN